MEILIRNRAWMVVKASLATILLLCGSQVLAAGTASNTQLQNTVTVNFDNLAGTAQTAVTAQVIITIELIEAIPTITFSSSVPTDLATLSEGQAIDLIYTITSNANGPDDYDLNITETGLTNLTGSVFTNPTDVAILGATTVAAAVNIGLGAGGADCVLLGVADCTVNVPNDDASDASVNGLEIGDTIVFSGGPVCTVTAINDAGGSNVTDLAGVAGTDFATIDFDSCDISASASLGQSVFERADITVNLTTGTVTGASGTLDVNVTALADGGTPSAAIITTITVLASDLDVYKYVRNITDPIAGTNASAYDLLSFNGSTYYRAGVTAAPGDVLEYALLMINNAGAIQGVIATDPAIAFTSYVAQGVFGIQLYPEEDITDPLCVAANTCVVTFAGGATLNADDTLGTATDIGGVTGGGVITVFAGVGGDENLGGTTPTGGTIAIDKVSVVLYRLTVQ